MYISAQNIMHEDTIILTVDLRIHFTFLNTTGNNDSKILFFLNDQ